MQSCQYWKRKLKICLGNYTFKNQLKNAWKVFCKDLCDSIKSKKYARYLRAGILMQSCQYWKRKLKICLGNYTFKNQLKNAWKVFCKDLCDSIILQQFLKSPNKHPDGFVQKLMHYWRICFRFSKRYTTYLTKTPEVVGNLLDHPLQAIEKMLRRCYSKLSAYSELVDAFSKLWMLSWATGYRFWQLAAQSEWYSYKWYQPGRFFPDFLDILIISDDLIFAEDLKVVTPEKTWRGLQEDMLAIENWSEENKTELTSHWGCSEMLLSKKWRGSRVLETPKTSRGTWCRCQQLPELVNPHWQQTECSRHASVQFRTKVCFCHNNCQKAPEYGPNIW